MEFTQGDLFADETALVKRKRCYVCKTIKTIDEFYAEKRRTDGLSLRCKICNQAQVASWVQRNPEKRRTSAFKYHLKSYYGLSEEDFRALGETCRICDAVRPAGGRFHVDHDHTCCPGEKSCGKCVRGLLCPNCNKGLGLFRDDPEALRRASDYIEKFRANQEVGFPSLWYLKKT